MKYDPVGQPPTRDKNVFWWVIGLIILALLIWWFVTLPALR